MRAFARTRCDAVLSGATVAITCSMPRISPASASRAATASVARALAPVRAQESVLDLHIRLSARVNEPAEADHCASAARLHGEHAIAALAIVGVGHLQPLFALKTRQRLAIADPAHRIAITVDIFERLQILRNPPADAKAAGLEKRLYRRCHTGRSWSAMLRVLSVIALPVCNVLLRSISMTRHACSATGL